MKTFEELEPEWSGDYLKRTNEGRYLIKYLNALYGDETDEILYGSFVLNLNAPWGYGKTYFLENLKKDLTELNHPVVYFDSWGNDYSNTPLLSFISEIQSSLKPYAAGTPKGRELLKSFNEKGKQVIGAVAGIGAEILAKKLTGFLNLNEEDIKRIGEKLSDKTESIIGAIVQQSIDEHQQLKTLIEEFKKSLENLMKVLNEHSEYEFPMYILVDELDRCRPDFAVELLENIKHIFNSKGVFFIVATNKEQLGNSIKAIYGSQFDSFNYLKRFFNQEYNLSLPDTFGFIEALFKKYRINDEKVFCSFEASLNKTENINIYIFSQLSVIFGLGLRDKEQICIQLKSILLTTRDEKLHYPFLIYLLIIKHLHKEGGFETSVNENLKKLSSENITIWMRDDSGGKTQGVVNYHNVISFYLRLINVTTTKLQELQANTRHDYQSQIIQFIYPLLNDKERYTDLSDYYPLVEKAGHFGIGAKK